MTQPVRARRPTIDVSLLPEGALDHHSCIWWGNLELLMIETTMFALLVASYFYIRQNFGAWPPPHVTGPVAEYNSGPRLGAPLVNLGIILASFAPMFWADRAALRLDCAGVARALGLTIVFGLAAIGVRFLEFKALRFSWDDNAYSAVVWTTVGLHLTHLIVGTCENFIMLVWIARKGLDKKHARDVRVTAGYWYWIVGIWIPLFVILFLAPGHI